MPRRSWGRRQETAMAGVCRRARRGVAVGSPKGSPGGQTAVSMGEVGGRAGGAGRRVLFARGTSRSQFGSSMTFRGEDRPIPACSSAKKRTEWQISCRDPCCWVSWEGGKVYLCRVLLFISASRQHPWIFVPFASSGLAVCLPALKLQRLSCCSAEVPNHW